MGLKVTRRRFLAITAAACAAGRVSAATPVATWRGPALGTLAEVRLAGITEPQSIFAAVEAELERIDRLFSLYRKDSALMRLNAEGVLASPDPNFLELLSLSRSAYNVTEGAFDPTVQPLFALHAACAAQGRTAAPDEDASARAHVGFDRVAFDRTAVRFTRPGMAMTFNGIAQGYATDRLSKLLKDLGLTNVMVNAGEVAGIGLGPVGQGWPVRLPGTDIRLRDRAVATSSANGTLIDPARNLGHIFDPLGHAVQRRGAVSVLHDSAAMADALSTAAIVMDESRWPAFSELGAEVITGPA